MHNKIKNTSKSPNVEWLGGGNPDTIEAQEAQGQKELVESSVLPVEMDQHSDYDTRKILEELGVKFLGVIEDDKIFQRVELPVGWKIEPTEHSMHSSLLDDKKRVRAGIFYKAAFYDRSAHLTLKRRYGCSLDYVKANKGVIQSNVKDQGKIIYSTDEYILKESDEARRWAIQNEHDKRVITWLNENCPEWENPGKYWD